MAMKKDILCISLLLIWAVLWYIISISFDSTIDQNNIQTSSSLLNTWTSDKDLFVDEKTYANVEYWYSIGYLSYYSIDNTKKDYVTMYPKWCISQLCSDFLFVSIESNPIKELQDNGVWSIESLYKERKETINNMWGDCQLLYKDPILDPKVKQNTSLQFIRCYYPWVPKQDKSSYYYYIFWKKYVYHINFTINQWYAPWYDSNNEMIKVNQSLWYDPLWDYMMQTFKLLE